MSKSFTISGFTGSEDAAISVALSDGTTPNAATAGSGTVALGDPTPPAHDAHIIVQRPIEREAELPISANIGTALLDTPKQAYGFRPRAYRAYFFALTGETGGDVIEGDAFRINLGSNPAFSTHNLPQNIPFASNALAGATAFVYRENAATNEWDLIRTSQVVTNNNDIEFGTWYYAMPNYVPTGTTTFNFSAPTNGRIDKPRNVWVRSIAPNGEVSEPSNAVVVHPTGAANVSNTTVDVPNTWDAKTGIAEKYGEQSGSVPAPTSLAAAPVGDGGVQISWTEPAVLSNVVGYVVCWCYGTQDRLRRPFHVGKRPTVTLEDDGGAAVQPGDFVELKLDLVNQHLPNVNPDWWNPEVTGNYLDQFNRINWRPLDISYHDNFIGLPGWHPVSLDGNAFATWTYEPVADPSQFPHTPSHFMRITVPQNRKFIIPYLGIWAPSETAHEMEFIVAGTGAGTVHLETALGLENALLTGASTPQPIPATPTSIKMTVAQRPGEDYSGLWRPVLYGGSDPAGSTFDVYLLRSRRVDKEFMQPSSITQEFAANAPGALYRTHAWVNGPGTTQQFGLREFCTEFNAINCGIEGHQTMGPRAFRTAEDLGLNLWFQVPGTFVGDDIDGMLEYFATPYDPLVDTPETKPWAYLRHLHRPAGPWVEAFDRIVWERSNEMWNGLFTPWYFHDIAEIGVKGSVAYARFCDVLFRKIKAHPDMAAHLSKCDFALGGQRSFPFSTESLAATKEATMMSLSAYNGGSDENEPYAPRPSEAVYARRLNYCWRETMDGVVKKIGVPAVAKGMKWGFYETNGGHRNAGAHVDGPLVANAKATAVGLCAAWLLARRNGATDACILGWSSSTSTSYVSHKWHDGSLVAHPQTQYAILINRLCAGRRRLKTSIIAQPRTAYWREAVSAYDTFGNPSTLADPTQHYPLIAQGFRQDADFTLVVANVDQPLASLAVDNPNLVNRPDETGFHRVMVELPFTTAQSATLYRLTGAWDAETFTGNNIALEEIPLTPPADLRRVMLDEAMGCTAQGMPPSEVYFWKFEGVA